MSEEKICFNRDNIIAIYPKYKDPTHTTILTVEGEERCVVEEFNLVLMMIPRD
jgi:hypothetical protein